MVPSDLYLAQRNVVVFCSICPGKLPYFPILSYRPRIGVCSVAVRDLSVSSDPSPMKSLNGLKFRHNGLLA